MTVVEMTRIDGAILVGVDGSPGGWDALAWAAAEAAESGRALHIVHVVGWPRVSDVFALPQADAFAAVWAAGQSVLDEAVRRAADIAPALRVVAQMEAGRPGDAIVRKSRDDSLIVLGRRRRRGSHAIRFRFGSVASRVAQRTERPIVIVGLSSAAAGPATGRIAVLVDDQAGPSTVLVWAFSGAARRGIGVPEPIGRSHD